MMGRVVWQVHFKAEIRSQWQEVRQIVTRDLNQNDPQIGMYLKMASG